LRNNFSNLGTTGNRSLDDKIIVVDEVDNLFVDDSSKIAMLSDKLPGMSKLNIYFIMIWSELNKLLS